MALQPDEDGDLPLHVAIAHGMTEQIETCISHMTASNVSLDHQNSRKQTPLHLAVFDQNQHLVKKLLQAGSNPNNAEVRGMTALQLAVYKRDGDILKLILQESKVKVDLDNMNHEGMAALHMAVLTSQGKMVTTLLRAGACADLQDGRSGRTALHHAAEKNLYEVADRLLQEGAKTDVTSYAGVTPVRAAKGRGHSDMVRLLVQYGASLGDPSDPETKENQ